MDSYNIGTLILEQWATFSQGNQDIICTMSKFYHDFVLLFGLTNSTSGVMKQIEGNFWEH